MRELPEALERAGCVGIQAQDLTVGEALLVGGQMQEVTSVEFVPGPWGGQTYVRHGASGTSYVPNETVIVRATQARVEVSRCS